MPPVSGTGLNEQKFLSTPKLVAIAMAFCVFVPAAGAFAEEVGGIFGALIWLVAWCVLIAVAVMLTKKFSNPHLPVICGVMVGMTFPRPTEAWICEQVGDASGRAVSMVTFALAVWIGTTVFTSIAKKNSHQASAVSD